MNNSGIIQTPQNPDLTTFKVLIEGQEVGSTVEIKSINVHLELNRVPTAQLYIIDGDPASGDFKVSSDELFTPGKKIEISAGYHSDEETIFKGVVVKHSIKISQKNSLLFIECKDEFFSTTIDRNSAYYYDAKDSDVIEEIIGKYALSHEIAPTNHAHKELVQYHSSDWDFIMSRAQANGKVCVIENGLMQVTDPSIDTDPVETITFGANILDFDGEIDARKQYLGVEAMGWSSADQKKNIVEAENQSIDLHGNLKSNQLAEVSKLDKFHLYHGVDMEDISMQNWADAKLLFHQLAKVRGRVKFQGIAGVKPNTIIELAGVGDKFNGKAYVSGVKHQISEGNWTVDAQFGLNPQWFAETYDIAGPSAAGLFPPIKGLHVGVVTQLEGDPSNEYKIKVKIPIINEKEQGIWCRICTLDAGSKRGTFFLPYKGDEVIVGFLNEDPNQGVVLGMVHSSAHEAPLAHSDDNHERGIVTKSEMQFLFNDEKKTITLQTKNGKKIFIEDDKSILIEDDYGNNLTMNNEGITLKSKNNIDIKTSADVNIEGMNVNIKANGQMKADGTGGIEMSSSAIAKLKGSLVQIN